MDADERRVDALAETIGRYLSKHRNAADTLEGIATWWLPGSADNDWLGHVKAAMEQLMRQGKVVRQTMADGTVIYERNKKHD
jgi:hypothetical protein